MLTTSKVPLPRAVAAQIRRVSSTGRETLEARVRQFSDRLYYRYLFGLKVPGAPVLTRKLAAWERRRGRGDVPLPPETWESQYRAGRWVYLNGVQQMTRYSVIAGCIQALKRGGWLLDIGCGEGILLERLGAADYARFVGVDLSRTAIERAQQKQLARSVFVHADARDFVPGDVFDAIIFNEVLYYFDDPLAVARRYEPWLKRDGCFITSLFAASDRARAINRLLKRSYSCLDEVEIRGNGRSWIIDVLVPKPADAT